MTPKTFELPLFGWINTLKNKNVWVFNEWTFFNQHQTIQQQIKNIKHPTVIIVECLDAVHPFFNNEYQNFLNFILDNVITNSLIKFIFVSVNYFSELVNHPTYYYFPEYHAYYYPMYANSKLDDSSITKKFLSLNKREDPIRQMLYIKFFNDGLLKDSYFSYLGENNSYTNLYACEQWEDNWNLINDPVVSTPCPEVLTWSNPQDKFIKIDNDSLLNQYRGTNNHCGADPTWLADNAWYQSSFCSIIVETGPTAHKPNFSEKTFRAIMQGHPIILIGAKNSVKMLRDFGFDMFDDIIDHGYDSISDCPFTRTSYAFKEINKINSYTIDQLTELKHSLKSRREQNILTYQTLYHKMLAKHDAIFSDIKTLISKTL